MSDWTSVLVWALRTLGAAFVLLALAHLWLPRALRWRPVAESAVGDVVARMHSGYVALFVGVVGAVCLLAPGELLGGGRLAVLVLAGATLTFGLRAVAEVVWVGPALRRDAAPAAVRRLHVVALVAWPGAALIFGAALAVSFR